MIIAINIIWIAFILQELVNGFKEERGKCGYEFLPKEDIVIGIKVDSMVTTTWTERPPYSPLQIHLEYTASVNSYKNAELLKKDVIEPARLELESMITVKNPTNGLLKVERTCLNSAGQNSQKEIGCMNGCKQPTTCVKQIIPDKFLKKCKVMDSNGVISYTGEEGAGVLDVDIILVVYIKECHMDTLASAASCFLEAELDRPILGILNICKGRMNAGENILRNIISIQHEIIHALGFAASKFAFYRNQDGSPMVERDSHNLPIHEFNNTIGAYMWTDSIAKEVTRRRGNIHGSYNKSTFALTLPTVLDIARNHFDCATLDGVDLDDYPILSHFSEYVLYNEIMTPVNNGANDKISHFSLALLHDTGWYHVDFSKANNFIYGQKKGCSIIVDGCYLYMQNQKRQNLPIFPFCDQIFNVGNIFKCSRNRKYFYFCNIVKHNYFPPKYQYFTQLDGVPDDEATSYGGVSEINEFCPSISVTSKPSSLCRDENNNNMKNNFNILNSFYGPQSMCFKNGIHLNGPVHYYGASCQKYFFNREEKTLQVYFKGITVFCPSEELYAFPAKWGFIATFTCPNLVEIEALLDEEYNYGNKIKNLDNANRYFYFVIIVYEMNYFLT